MKLSKDLMVQSEELNINDLYYVRSLRGARKIKYVRVFNRVHRSTTVDPARTDPRSTFTLPCEVACWLKQSSPTESSIYHSIRWWQDEGVSHQ